jgi:hypothetical protein
MDGVSISVFAETDGPLVKQSGVLQRMLEDVGAGGDDPAHCQIPCDDATLALVLRLMMHPADADASVDMTRKEMVVALRLMHFLDIPWEPYRRLKCGGSGSGGSWDTSSVQAWVELVQLDRRATTFEVYKSIWDPDTSPVRTDAPGAVAIARALRAAWAAMLGPRPVWEAFAALFGQHGSDLTSPTVVLQVGATQEVNAVEAAIRWIRRAAEIARAEGTFEALALEMLAAWDAEDAGVATGVAGGTTGVAGIALKALALGAVREGVSATSASLPRLVRAASALLKKKYRDVEWERAFEADVVGAIDFWDGVVGSDYDAFLCLKSPHELVRLAVMLGHALKNAAHKWLALVDRTPDQSRVISDLDNLLYRIVEMRLLGPRMPLEVVALINSRRFPLSTLRHGMMFAIGRNGLWYGFGERMTVVLDAFRDRFRDPKEPGGDPTERQFIEDLLAIVNVVQPLDPPVAALGLRYVQRMFDTATDPAVRSQMAEHLHKVAVDLANLSLLTFHQNLLKKVDQKGHIHIGWGQYCCLY